MPHIRFGRTQIITLVVAAIVTTLGVVYYLRDISDTYYFDNLKTPNCEIQSSSPECKLSVIHLQTVTGDDVYFYYNKSKLIADNKTHRLSGFRNGEKVQVTFAGDPNNPIDPAFISKIRAVN